MLRIVGIEFLNRQLAIVSGWLGPLNVALERRERAYEKQSVSGRATQRLSAPGPSPLDDILPK